MSEQSYADMDLSHDWKMLYGGRDGRLYYTEAQCADCGARLYEYHQGARSVPFRSMVIAPDGGRRYWVADSSGNMVPAGQAAYQQAYSRMRLR